MSAISSSSRLDELVERWTSRGGPRHPIEDLDPPKTMDAVEPMALVEALKNAVCANFEGKNKELSLALALLDHDSQMDTTTTPSMPTRVFDLVQTMFAGSGVTSLEAKEECRERLAALLDDLEDLLEGLDLAAANTERPIGGST